MNDIIKQKFVLGFLFNEDRTSVILILKRKPDWQKGLLNGVGGKVENNENELQAMIREYLEETGQTTTILDWEPYAEMEGPDWQVFCFKSFNTKVWEASKTTEDEEVWKVLLTDLQKYKTLSNIKWLIEIALDKNYGKRFYVNAKYN